MNIYTHENAAMYSVPNILTLTSKSGIKLVPHATPTSIEGVVYFDQTSNILKYRSNSAWNELSLGANVANSLADKISPTHIASGVYRETATEHMYVSSNTISNIWKSWSQDGFVDFRRPYTFKGAITFSNPTVFYQPIALASIPLQNVAYPTQQTDVATMQYITNSLNPNSPSSIKYQTTSMLKAMITQIETEHDKLQALWNDRKAFKKVSGGGFYGTAPSDSDYWAGAGLLTAMITTIQRLRNAGRI